MSFSATGDRFATPLIFDFADVYDTGDSFHLCVACDGGADLCANRLQSSLIVVLMVSSRCVFSFSMGVEEPY